VVENRLIGGWVKRWEVFEPFSIYPVYLKGGGGHKDDDNDVNFTFN
jgi:hypothetical protein